MQRRTRAADSGAGDEGASRRVTSIEEERRRLGRGGEEARRRIGRQERRVAWGEERPVGAVVERKLLLVVGWRAGLWAQWGSGLPWQARQASRQQASRVCI